MAAPPAEDSFETRLRTVGLIAGPLACAAIWILNPGDHPPEARRLLGILALAVCYWMTEAIPLPATALLASALAIVSGVAPARAVLAPYADPVIFLFIGSFLLAEAFSLYGIDRTVATALVRHPRFRRSTTGLMSAIGLTSAAISTVLSNTATAALMTPVARAAALERAGAGADVAEARRHPWVSGILLIVAYGASVGGMATIIGTPPNLLVAGFIDRLAGVKVTFTAWLLFGIPISVTLLAASMLLTRAMLGGEALARAAAPAQADPGAPALLEPASRAGRRWTIAACLLALFLWTLPAVVGLALGQDHPLERRLAERLPEAGVALLCAALLFVAPVSWKRREFALTWQQGRQVNWGIIMLFGGGLSLGTLAEQTDLARWAGEWIRETGLASTPAGLLALSIGVTILVSEFASNTAAATLLVPVAIAAAQSLGFDPVRPALGVGIAATCGFIFPVSTPPNAIVFGTGLVPLRRMVRVGILLDLVSFLVVWLGMLALTPLLPR